MKITRKSPSAITLRCDFQWLRKCFMLSTIKNKSGIMLVEVLLATVILVFAGVAMIQFYLSSLGMSEANKEETIAMAHLINMAEAIKCTPFSNIIADFPDGAADGPLGNAYAALAGGYILADEHIVVSYVNPGSDPLEITVSVSWLDRKGLNRAKYLVTKRTK